MATYKGNHILTSGKSELWSTLTIGTATNNPLTYVVPAYSGGELYKGNSTSASINYRIYSSYLNGESGDIYDTGSHNSTASHSAGSSWSFYGTRNIEFIKQKEPYSAYIKATLTTNGSTSTATYSFTVPAITSYAITYSANGGDGAPESQSKWHDEAVTLSSTVPTRNGFAFKGWSTSSSAETVDYTAGATYTTNSAVVLYAVWELLQDIRGGRMTSAYRCDSNGTAQDDGTYAKFVCTYTLLGAGQNNGSVTAQYKPTSSSTWTTVSSSLVKQTPTPSKSASAPSLEVTVTVGAVPNFSQDSSYDVRVIARDSASTPHEVTMTGTISIAYFTMDFAEGGKGIGIGTPISKSETTGHSNGVLKIAMDVIYKDEPLADYVIEQGTYGIWTYRKWASGLAEAWGRKDVVVSSGAVWTSPLYYSTQTTGQVSYPLTFAEIPNEIVSISSATNACWAYKENSPYGNTVSATATYRAIKVGAFASGSQTVTFNFDVKGKWK